MSNRMEAEKISYDIGMGGFWRWHLGSELQISQDAPFGPE
jgi:hypothetical protein